jgi:hypothetical protein
LVLGIAFFMGLWMLAALLTPLPAAASAARAVAFAITWAAATVGLGATILSRAGARNRAFENRQAVARSFAEARRVLEDEALAPAAPPPPGWQTPTPVSGVVAARRSSSTPFKES